MLSLAGDGRRVVLIGRRLEPSSSLVGISVQMVRRRAQLSDALTLCGRVGSIDVQECGMQ